MTEKPLELDHRLDPGSDSQSETHSEEMMGEHSESGSQLIINPEVTELILRNLNIFCKKLCRLVSKQFNTEISRIINCNGVIVQLYDAKSIPLFKEVYRQSREMSPALPSPFATTRLRLEADSKSIVDFYNLSVECPELQVTELKLWGYPGDEVRISREYLEVIAPTLTKLEAYFWNTFPDCSEIQFPLLRELGITSDYTEAWGLAFNGLYWKRKVDFWRGIIGRSPRLLNLICKDMRLARELFESCDMAGIRTLFLSRCVMEGAGNSPVRALMTSNILHLTKLSLKCDLSDIQIRNGVNVTIARSARSLKSLSLWSNVDIWTGMRLCPLLSHLTLKTLYVGSFKWEQAPKLRSLRVQRIVVVVGAGAQALVPCLSVEKVWLGGSSEETVRFPALFKVFPRARHWRLGHLSLLPEFCVMARACNANIQGLGLVPCLWGKEALPKNVILPSCLKQLRQLWELEIVSDINCTISPISCWLEELPNIKALRWQMPLFGLQSCPHYTALAGHLDSLKLLKRVELIQFPRPVWDAELEKLFSMLPAAVRVQKLIVHLEPNFV